VPHDPVGGESRRAQARDWWRDAVIYQIYPRSFADGNADGIGDIAGIRARLDHVARLGVDAIWISPWFASPMADHGYDVADYRAIDPVFGDLDEAQALIEEAHALGLKVILDLVANHTSDRHPWFQRALIAPAGSLDRDLYHFRDGRGPSGELPPNDWISAFGGGAWSRTMNPDGSPGQWYLHLFAPEQPDLNWENPEVLAEFDAVLRFWFDLGVDGLRIDVAAGFAKAPGLPDFGVSEEEGFFPTTWSNCPFWDVDAVHGIYRSFRKIADSYDNPRIFVGEVIVNGPRRLARYLRDDELHTAFNLDYLKSPWDAAALHRVIDSTLDALAEVGAPPTWVLSSHDETRHVTRYGQRQPSPGESALPSDAPSDLAIGTRRARAALLLMLGLPGSAYLYQGEELGLPEVADLPTHALQDPVYRRSGGAVRGRDGCRVPLPWSGDRPPYGFSQQPDTWLPQPADWSRFTVGAEDDEPDSMLELYTTAIRLRKNLAGFDGEDFAWLEASDTALHFERGDAVRCLVNFGASNTAVPGSVIISSVPLVDGLLPCDASCWYRIEDRDSRPGG
jgi:alpha-glucosidase